LKNYDRTSIHGTLIQQLLDEHGARIATAETTRTFTPGQTVTVRQQIASIAHPHLWSDKDPYLYTLVSIYRVGEKIIDEVRTPCGIRVIHWSEPNAPGTHPFLLNDHPVF